MAALAFDQVLLGAADDPDYPRTRGLWVAALRVGTVTTRFAFGSWPNPVPMGAAVRAASLLVYLPEGRANSQTILTLQRAGTATSSGWQPWASLRGDGREADGSRFTWIDVAARLS